MDAVADHLDQAADALTAVSREVPALTVTPAAFAALSTTSGFPAGSGAAFPSSAGAADGPGLPGRLGRALHDHWAAVLEARAHEMSTTAARLATMAASVRTTRRHYAETDEAVERRFTQEM